jgi:uncharacterized membrane protein SpoIIM required for sporulation
MLIVSAIWIFGSLILGLVGQPYLLDSGMFLGAIAGSWSAIYTMPNRKQESK